MAHEFESGFFSRQPAWHGLGEVLPEPPKNALEALKKSGLDWNVNTMPLYANSPAEEWIDTPYNALVRSSDKKVLGVVKGRWTPYQNIDAMEWTIPLIESGHWEYEAAGSLKKGERCWALLRQRTIEIVPNDELRQYLMVCWAHDGKSANFIQPTSVRVVCMNTLNAALNEAGVMRFAVRHSQFVKLNMENIKELLQITTDSFETQRIEFQKMAQKQIAPKKVGVILDELFPASDKAGKAQTISEQKRDIIESLIDHGSGIQENGLAGTHYGVYSGISEAVEHYLGGNRITDRGENILFRGGRQILDKAFELLRVA